ncbi:hypothetical protein CL617_03765 [archaeon]|nr:hypothetical protein [archaeon]|tara:strand:+ start:3536 stop:4048 length:513 start_codon:yes stop_codon:yes gene_type:complete
MFKSKRGMIQQVFVYILIIVVVGFVFIFGFNMISKFLDVGEEAKLIDFKNKLDKEVNDIFYKSPGSLIEYSKGSSRKPLALPEDVSKICVINKDESLDLTNLNDDEKIVLENINDNVVLLPFKDKYSFDVNGLKVSENPLCFRIINGAFSFVLESKFLDGENFVEISKVE